MSAHLHDHGELDPPRLEQVADGVYAYIQPDGTWWINNAGFVVGDEGVVAIDTCATERRTRLFLDHVAAVTDQPIRILVNTHHHGDHTHGNSFTHPAAIVGHDRCRSAMIAAGIEHHPGVFGDPEPPEWGELTLAPPMVTFSDLMHVHTGRFAIELRHLGTPAHTDNDVVAWLPDQRVLFAGDLVFNGGTPFMLMGSVEGSLRAIEGLRSFDAEVVVPGHGPVCDPSVLDGLADYDRFVLELARTAVDAGAAPLEAARDADLGRFAHLTDPERIVGNLHRAMFEMGGAEPGAPIDLAAAIGDMIAFNGGRPLRCLA
ncbi:MBL fold metallo-hydrolase [Ilumatobacter sp.]|uniref:MBL fold metallo-hydrolase n=1 Tax=Ilumatobacter sp. TaxID=1967498 RepID=UPI003B526A99